MRFRHALLALAFLLLAGCSTIWGKPTAPTSSQFLREEAVARGR